MTVTVNLPPLFSEELFDQIVEVNEFKTYTLPSYKDPEGSSVTLTTTKYMSNLLPSFVSYNKENKTYLINPVKNYQMGQ